MMCACAQIMHAVVHILLSFIVCVRFTHGGNLPGAHFSCLSFV